jgi:hypothetical protein
VVTLEHVVESWYLWPRFKAAIASATYCCENLPLVIVEEKVNADGASTTDVGGH